MIILVRKVKTSTILNSSNQKALSIEIKINWNNKNFITKQKALKQQVT